MRQIAGQPVRIAIRLAIVALFVLGVASYAPEIRAAEVTDLTGSCQQDFAKYEDIPHKKAFAYVEDPDTGDVICQYGGGYQSIERARAGALRKCDRLQKMQSVGGTCEIIAEGL